MEKKSNKTDEDGSVGKVYRGAIPEKEPVTNKMKGDAIKKISKNSTDKYAEKNIACYVMRGV